MFAVREMVMEDLNQVLEVEQQSFASPWSRQAFEAELTQNRFAHYLVAESEGKIVGYGGVWVVFDEAHVTNIAVHPSYRGKKVGEAILRALILLSRIEGADRMTLEVRPSNLVAQKLYWKFGFKPVGVRKGYYTDNGEDAIIMWCDDLDAGCLGEGC